MFNCLRIFFWQNQAEEGPLFFGVYLLKPSPAGSLVSSRSARYTSMELVQGKDFASHSVAPKVVDVRFFFGVKNMLFFQKPGFANFR